MSFANKFSFLLILLLLLSGFDDVAERGLDLLDLVGHDDGVGLPDLLGPKLLVVERALVLITVTVHWTEEPSTAALEAWNKRWEHALVTEMAS